MDTTLRAHLPPPCSLDYRVVCDVADGMLCFSGNGILSIKTDTFPLHSQRHQGSVVGFKSSTIYMCARMHSHARALIPKPSSWTITLPVRSEPKRVRFPLFCEMQGPIE